MSKALTLEDDGYLRVTVPAHRPTKGSGDPEIVTLELDIFETFNDMVKLWKEERAAAEKEGRTALQLPVWVAYLKERHKVGDASHWFARKFFDMLEAEVERLQKKDPSAEPALIPKLTGSPSGPTPDGGTPPA